MSLRAAATTFYRARRTGRARSLQIHSMPAALAGVGKIWFVLNILLACSLAKETAQSSSLNRHPNPTQEARTLLQQGRSREALEVIQTYKDTMEPLEYHLLAGTAYTLEPDIVNARKEFEAAVHLAPERATIHSQYGVALMRLSEFADARKELTQALAPNPRSAAFHFSLGLLNGREDNPADADKEIRRAIELTHDPARLRSYLTIDGQMLLLARSWFMARKAFEKAISLDKTNAPAWAGLGEALFESNSGRGAIVALKKAVALDPKNAVAFDHLGEAEMRLGDYVGAAAAYSSANALRPSSRPVLYHLVRALTMCGRAREAERFEAQLKSMVEKEASVNKAGLDLVGVNQEAISLEQQGDYSAAEADYRREVEIDPENQIFRRNLGLVLCRQGRWDEGLSELKKALEINPDDVESVKALNAAITARNNQN